MKSRFPLLAWLSLIWAGASVIPAQENVPGSRPPSESGTGAEPEPPTPAVDTQGGGEYPAPEAAPGEQNPEEPSLTANEAVQLGIRSVEIIDEESAQEVRQEAADDLHRCATALMATDPANPWLYYFRGCIYSYTGQRGDAVNELTKFIETNTGRNHWRAYRIIGDLFTDEFPALAESHYLTANRLNANEPSVLFGLSRAAEGLGRKQEAIEYARRATNNDLQRNIQYMSHLAKLLAEQKQFVEAADVAIQALDQAKAERDQDPTVGERYAVLEARYRQLLMIGRAQIKERPEAGHLYGEVATYLLELSEVQHDRALLDALTTLDLGIGATAPNTPLKLFEQRAALLVQLERLEEARAAYERILEDYPTSQAARDFLARHQRQHPEVKEKLRETKSPQSPDRTAPRNETQSPIEAEPPDTAAPSNP